MNLSEDFWRTQKGLLLVSESGELRFTAAGRAHYAPILAKYGISISSIKTLEQFREIMRPVNQDALDANTNEMLRILNDPSTTPEERALIERVLNL